MRKPDSVKKQAQRADELLAELTEAENPEVQGDGHGQEVAEGAQLEGTAQKTEEPTETPEPQASEMSAENDAYKARYEVIKGKYDAEVPRLTQQVRELQAQIDELTQEKEKLQALANSQNTEAELQEPAESQTLKQLREELGDENIANLITQLVQEQAKTPAVTEGDFNEIKNQLNTIQQGEQKRQEEVLFEARKNKLNQLLSADGINFDAINTDERFSEQGQFLDQIDPLTGMVRRDILAQAFMTDQLNVVARFFKEFHTEQNTNTRSQVLEQHVQVQPSSSSADARLNEQEVVYTPEDITQFYKNYDKYSPEERDRKEREILKQGRPAT